MMMIRTLVVVATILSVACGFWSSVVPAWSADRPRQPKPGDTMLSGTVSCKERVTLPGKATVRVELIDVSAKNARDATVGEDAYWITGGKLPVDFSIPYDRSRIDPGHVYVVRARVMDGEKVLLMSATPYHVLTRGAPKTVNVVVAPVDPRMR
jgi:putative lipoprotein